MPVSAPPVVRRAWRRAQAHWPQSTWIGYQLRRARSYLPPPSFGPLLAPHLVEAFASDRPRATVVQVGANDGIKLDPLRRHLLRRRWRAFLLEPVPFVYRQLVANTRFNRRITTVNVAIADINGTLPFHHLREDDDPQLPDWYDALGSFRRDVILSHTEDIPDVADRLVTIEVPTMTFDTFASTHDIAGLDLLHIDTEGYDLEVLRLVDLHRYRPAIVLFERLHLDAAERRAARSLLEEHGYEVQEDGMDTVAVLPAAAGPALRQAWGAPNGATS